jgi:hypothetical protein
MLTEAAKPVALVLCMAALCGVFSAAFLEPLSNAEPATGDMLALLGLAAGICLASGMLFCDGVDGTPGAVMRTLPMQMFLWSAGVMVTMYLTSGYLETHFYRDVRWF